MGEQQTDSEKVVYDDTIGANWRCIIITIILALGYWYLPRRNKWILLAILYFTYLAIAIYDHMFDCRRNMKPTVLALFYSWVKPRDSRQYKDYNKWSPAMKTKILIIDLLILFFILVFVLPWFLRWKPN